jgi:hypothetical protein
MGCACHVECAPELVQTSQAMCAEHSAVRLEAAVSPAAHRYVSTACQHGKHDVCRERCKYCSSLCLCPCHHAAGGGAPSSRGQ